MVGNVQNASGTSSVYEVDESKSGEEIDGDIFFESNETSSMVRLSFIIFC